jgi:hypothetical protein
MANEIKQLSEVHGLTKTFLERNNDFIVRDIENLIRCINSITGEKEVKAGKLLVSDFALVSGVRKATVTFSTPFPDADYTPSIVISSPDNYSVSVESVADGSFIVNLNSSVAPTANVYWSAVKHGEF